MSIEIGDGGLENIKIGDSDVAYVYAGDNLVYQPNEEDSE